MRDQLGDQTADLMGGIDQSIGAVQEGLGGLDTEELVDLREWVSGMQRRLMRLEYAIAAALPVAELQDQIAVAEATDRLAQERDRVAKAKVAHRDGE